MSDMSVVPYIWMTVPVAGSRVVPKLVILPVSALNVAVEELMAVDMFSIHTIWY